MKTNFTQIGYFTLSAYVDTGHFTYLYVIILLFLYILIICSNLLLIVIICMNRRLHEPMYIFLCSLFVNEVYGSTALFPFILGQIPYDIHIVSAYICFLQVFCVYSYGSVEFFTLTIMSYDRYVAICFPLEYNTCMTSNKVAMLIALTWLPPLLVVVGLTSMSFSLQLCGNIINNVYCDNNSIVRLACSNTSIHNIYGLISTALIVFVPLIFILYTYIRILKVCFSGSKQTRQKAVSTCTPHLASLLNFSFGCFFEVLQNRFKINNLPDKFGIFVSLYFVTCQMLFNPVLYGLKMSTMRKICARLFQCEV
ncbi:Olfactory receptor 10A3 HTPCRX12 Olfactory receptor OR11-97 [Channa argus]|uniref:Olfactory receptor n=2 Tax=Channa argus TaxID=215402 RepID=A0A6G1PT48_CHAAH|nr:Olfactory receptor 10A3 HTPCRX12 Olfactory receptor OR11-97 [Channa argus]